MEPGEDLYSKRCKCLKVRYLVSKPGFPLIWATSDDETKMARNDLTRLSTGRGAGGVERQHSRIELSVDLDIH